MKPDLFRNIFLCYFLFIAISISKAPPIIIKAGKILNPSTGKILTNQIILVDEYYLTVPKTYIQRILKGKKINSMKSSGKRNLKSRKMMKKNLISLDLFSLVIFHLKEKHLRKMFLF
jgi:hypothetical protein